MTTSPWTSRQGEKQASICPKSGSKIQSQRNQILFSLRFLPARKCHNTGKTNRKKGLTFSSPPKYVKILGILMM